MATTPSPPHEPAAPPPEPDPTPGVGVPSVLVIEDDPDVCGVITAALREAGYHPLVAYTAIAGLAQARDRQPDLVLLDLRLPDLDGLTLLGHLAADPRTAALPALVISGYVDVRMREACRAAGARAVVPKSLDADALRELVTTYTAIPVGVRPPGAGPRGRWESVIGQGISRLVHADLDATRVCQAVVDGACELLGLTAASLWLLDGKVLELRVQSSVFETTTRSQTRIAVGEGLIGAVALERRPLTTADAARDARVKNRATFEALGLRAFLAVPLLHDGCLLGVLSGARLSARPFEAEDLQMLGALADHAAAVLEQARLLQESERRRRTAEVLAALAVEVSAAQSPESVLDRVLGYVQELVAADITYLAVHEPQAAATPLLVVRGARGPTFARLTFQPGQGAIGRVMADGKPFRTADYLSEPGISHEFDYVIREEGVTAVLVVPVRLKGTVVGVLGGSRRDPRPFTDDDERVLVQLAAQAAVALGNVWLYREVALGKQQWETTVNHLHEGLALLDADLRILQVNQALAGWIGQGPEGLVGRAVGAVLPVYATAGAQARLAAARAGRAPKTATIEDGRGRALEETLAPVTEADGAPAGLVVTLRDVTEARRLQGQLLTAEKLASLGEMLAGIAHELNNPLTGVLGFAQLLEAQVTEPAQREDLRKLAQEAQRAARLVQRLLRFARQHPPDHRPTDLNALVRAAVELLEGPCRREGIVLEADLTGDLPVTFADPHQLQQVVVNLATNARQAMVSAGRRGRIRFATRREGAWLELHVSDEGPGIRPEVLPRIFDPFFTTKAPGEGTGLGLSLCHAVVTAHGGDIWAESVPDRGATLHVRLPIVLPPASEPEAASAPAIQGRSPSPRRVLAVDDEPLLRDLLLKALVPRGHVVETVADGAAALERLRAARYDVLLLDVRMPGLDGRETLERLHADPPADLPRVVLMTGDSVRPETRLWLEATGLPVLGKPFTLEALVAAVEEEAPQVRPG